MYTLYAPPATFTNRYYARVGGGRGGIILLVQAKMSVYIIYILSIHRTRLLPHLCVRERERERERERDYEELT